MQGTKYETRPMFYHDALNLMTNNETIKRMCEKHSFQHWILPEQDLFCNKEELSWFQGRAPVNCPELNALDQSCNKDIFEAVNKHVAVTLSLEASNDRKLSLNTPSLAKKSYHQFFQDVAPESRQIVQNRGNIINSLK